MKSRRLKQKEKRNMRVWLLSCAWVGFWGLRNVAAGLGSWWDQGRWGDELGYTVLLMDAAGQPNIGYSALS